MARCVTRSGNELDVRREPVPPPDVAVVGGLEVDPPRHRVVRRGRRFIFCLLDEDRDARKQAVVPAVIEVQVGVDDGREGSGRHPQLAQRGEKIRPARPVQPVDQRAPLPDARINEEAGFAVENEEGEDLAQPRTFGMRLRKLELGNAERKDPGLAHLNSGSAA
jgi:hypothetical protein